MKARSIVSTLVLSLAAIGAAQAQTTPFQGVYGKTYSNVTREQVVEELRAARAAGLTGNQDPDNQPFTPQKATPAANANIAVQPSRDEQSLAQLKFGDIDNMPFQGS
ncbi:DUF4148 domain-containing protein [Bordetella genomosp. 9]|uniref:DUF4148 domain-containing protein n=1 Tax=Bordetella genomosp. 9 TaxID=1416803 RepID=A0A1W6YW81_9BORD|nr:DUF4148 domain-containing protein [Bordetella genomosp. 9]ARP85357.1 hypothetical protein CAL13_03345 [Bordetella genomosp. 9]ARP89341.1 hypothetical protein CAL14_02715 [Bordetella genomosp. 9]